MKNSQEYSKKISRLLKTLKKKYPKAEHVSCEDPVEAVIRAVICEKMTEQKTKAALKRFNEYFIDLNDLRVSRPDEIVDMLGEDNEQARQIAARLTGLLMHIFEKYDDVSLLPLKKLGKKQVRGVLVSINGINDFIVDYIMLIALKAHTIPLNENMIAYLKNNHLVHPEADHQQIQGFLMRQISVAEAYNCFHMLKCESEAPAPKTKTKAKTKKTTAGKKTEPETKKE